MKNISLELLLLPSFSSFLSVDVKGYNHSSDTEAEGVNVLLLSPRFFSHTVFIYPFLTSLV